MHAWRKSTASWRCGKTLYLSVPFTWQMRDAETLAKAHNGPVVAGGPAVKLMGAPWADTPDSCPFDTLAMHNPCATFTTRGCPRCCAFCAVPKIEGDFRELSEWKPAPLVCDNNLLAASKRHFERVIDSAMPFPMVDFNQGLDARLFSPWHAGQLARLRGVKVRFAFDWKAQEADVADAIYDARRAGLKDFGVYVLIGFRDTPDDALYRLEKVREWGIRPNPMRYQPLNTVRKDSFVAVGWTDGELRRTMRYYSRLVWLEHIPFSDYEPRNDELPLEFAAAVKQSGGGF